MNMIILYQNIDLYLLSKANTWYSKKLTHLSQIGLQNDINEVKK